MKMSNFSTKLGSSSDKTGVAWDSTILYGNPESYGMPARPRMLARYTFLD
jgi:hypothetical protein